MNIQLKEMILKFIDNGNTWDKVITDLNGSIIFEHRNIKLFEENRTKEYFDDWEKQLCNAPWWNIVKVERFI